MDNSSASRLTSSLGDDATCYDVFLSFRGEDTRDSFTDHLYDALGRSGLVTFRDNDEIDRGQELKPEIERAIKASKASIVVLSENYATSTWCLEELWLILEQRRECNHFLLPVFYHVDPSNVRKQSKTFKIQVETSTRWTSDNVNRWKSALTKVANLTGFVLSGPETKFLKEIVDTVYNELDCKKVHLPPDLIGMDTRYEEITSWLHQPNLEFLAICGMGGSGKTTLAKYIYNLNWKRFENMSFLEDIGTRCKGSHGLHELQEQLLKDILGGRKRKVPSVSRGTCKIEEALQTKRTLIVLDDIVEYSELVALLGTGKINAQSKIIITTENTDNWFKFSSHKCEQYKMKLLNDDESLELLSHHAFGSKIPVEGFKEVAAQAVRYCEGNPLGLGVLGSSLSNSNTILQWRSQLNLLEKDIHSLIQGVLMRSYMSLPFDFERELFLHIACFFIGKDMDYVVKILEPDYSAVFGIKTLINRCLLSVSSSNKLMMHRLLQETGRYIVRKEAVKLPEKRSRVWLSADSYKILRKGKGSKTIEGLTLDMEKLKEEGAVSKASNLTTVALEKMEKLKLLQLNFAELTGSHENFSEDLRWLCWFGFHLRTIPSGLFMGNLVALDMSYSNLEVFEPPMVLQSLQILNLKDSHNLLEIRNISMIPHLETLVLWNCHSLVRVCETIGELTSLALLNMTGCKHFCTREQINLLEEINASTSVTKQPPFSFPHSLQRLFLKDCNLECTDSFPLSFCVQPFLQYLNLGNSLFELLPCYYHLKNLRVLDLSLCSRLKLLLCLPSTLAELYVYYCKSLEKITFQSHRFTLQEFGYEGCINLSEIEGFLKLVPIAKLDEADLGHLKWLKKYQSHEVLLVGDDELTKGRSSNLQMLYEFDIMSTSLPHIKDLNRTPEYISESSSLSFDVPSCPKNRRLKGLNVTFKYTISGDEWAWFANISTANGVDLMYNPKVFGKPGFGEVGIWLGYWPIGSTLDVGDKVNVSIDVMNGLEVHECGASLVYTDDEIAEETMENNMGGKNFLGGDLSGFRLSTGAYYLCRRDFFELMEVVGRLTPDRFGVLVGDTIDYTEVRGWRMTGRPKQLNPSFTELKTVRCIIHGPQLEEIYNIAEMSESSLVDKTIEFRSSSILRETIKSGITSEISDAAAKDKSETYNLVTLGMSKAFVSDETTESASIPHEVKSKSKSKSVVTYGNSKQPPLIQASDNQVSLADFDTVKVVGKGNGGVVLLVQHKWTGLFFALKVIQMNVEESARKQIAQELKINQSSECPNVVACYQSFYDNGAVSIILEYMDGGSLAGFLKTVRSIPEPYLAAICKQVLRGLWYLHHEKHIIHRDLKPSNLLINHRGEVKITNFGVSTILASTSGVANTFVGTYNYMSPERILGGNYDYKSDIWSLGLVLLECATGQFPYPPPQPVEGWVNVYELMETIVGQPPPRPPSDQFSPQFCSFIDACMQKDPKDRSSANELMSHPFINMFDDLAIDLASYFTEAGSPLATSDIVAAVPNSVLKSVFGVGFVSEDFNEYKSDRLQGENTINHVGYSTAGDQLTVQERRHSL